jgi:cell division protein FtsX
MNVNAIRVAVFCRRHHLAIAHSFGAAAAATNAIQ